MKRFVTQFIVWRLWRSYNRSLKLVLGHRTIAQARHEEFYLKAKIEKENHLPPIIDGLTWDNTGKTDRAVFARWLTLKRFCEWGEQIALFKTMDFPKIMEALGGKNGV